MPTGFEAYGFGHLAFDHAGGGGSGFRARVFVIISLGLETHPRK